MEIDERIEPLPFNADGFSEDDPLVREIKRNEDIRRPVTFYLDENGQIGNR